MTDLHTSHETLAQRKERLLLQCRAYRVAVEHSRKVVHDKLDMRTMAAGAFGMAGLRAQSALSDVAGLLDLRSMSTDKLRKLLPLLASGYSLLAGRSLLKPALKGVLIIGGAGMAAYLYSRRKTSAKKHEHVALHEHL